MSRSARILVVDDDRSHLALLQNRLAESGYEVILASSAREGLELLSATLTPPPPRAPDPTSFDLVILDILMPDLEGTEVLQHVRESLPSHLLPVIMATAKDGSQDIVEALRAGANDYVTKPINLDVLLARIETQLSLRRAHRSLRDAQHSLMLAARMESVAYLASGVTHEILDPGAKAAASLDLLHQCSAITEDPALSQALQTTDDFVTSTNRVVRKLNDFSTERDLDLQPRDARQVAEDAIELLQTELADADIYVETEFDHALPAALFASEELRQVLVIVLLNAIEAMPDLGCITVRTGVQVSEEASLVNPGKPDSGISRGDSVVCIEILDNGTGLQGVDPLVPFDAFYTTKNSASAVGLGLTIARKLMDLQGGLIRIADRSGGEGACVTISLRPAEVSTVPPRSGISRPETAHRPATL